MTTPAEKLAIYSNISQLSSFFTNKVGIFSILSYAKKNEDIFDGVTIATTALEDAITAAVVEGGIVLIPTTENGSTYLIDDDVTVPSNVTLQNIPGAILKGSVGTESLTVNGGISGDITQKFDNLIVTGSPKCERVYPQWFGVNSDGSTDDSSAFNKAADITRNEFYIPEGDYAISNPVYIYNDIKIVSSPQAIIRLKNTYLFVNNGADRIYIDSVDVRATAYYTNRPMLFRAGTASRVTHLTIINCELYNCAISVNYNGLGALDSFINIKDNVIKSSNDTDALIAASSYISAYDNPMPWFFVSATEPVDTGVARSGRVTIKNNLLEVWHQTDGLGGGDNIAKITGSIRDVKVKDNTFTNFNDDADAEFDMFSGGMFEKFIGNTFIDTKIKTQNIQGALAPAVGESKYAIISNNTFEYTQDNKITVAITFFTELGIISNNIFKNKISEKVYGFSCINCQMSDEFSEITGSLTAAAVNITGNLADLRVTGEGQQETITCTAGESTGAGNITMTITAAGMTNSPKAVVVPVGLTDGVNDVGLALRTALVADTDVSSFFTVSGADASVILTAITLTTPRDYTIAFSYVDTDATGVTFGSSTPIIPDASGIYFMATDSDLRFANINGNTIVGGSIAANSVGTEYLKTLLSNNIFASDAYTKTGVNSFLAGKRSFNNMITDLSGNADLSWQDITLTNTPASKTNCTIPFPSKSTTNDFPLYLLCIHMAGATGITQNYEAFIVSDLKVADTTSLTAPVFSTLPVDITSDSKFNVFYQGYGTGEVYLECLHAYVDKGATSIKYRFILLNSDELTAEF